MTGPLSKMDWNYDFLPLLATLISSSVSSGLLDICFLNHLT